MTDSSISLVKRYVFDLDGTLFLTRELVRRAYLEVGVVMPDDAWGEPASRWLPIVAGKRWQYVHEAKNEKYLRLIREEPPARTTAASAMIELSLSGVETYVVTGASRDAAQALLKAAFQPYHYRLLATSCDLSTKTTRVKMLGQPNECVYVDDDWDACDHMTELGYRVIHYKSSMTKEGVLVEWARSSLRRDAANG